MLDMRYIRENSETVKRDIALRGLDTSLVDIDKLLELDNRRKELSTRVEELQAQRNKASQEIKQLSGAEKQTAIERVRSLKEELTALEPELSEVSSARETLWRMVPNRLSPETPHGKEADSVVLRQWGNPRSKENTRDHVELGRLTDTIDLERGAKVSGARFYFLKREAVLLEQALLNLAVATCLRHGFVPLTTPDLARDDILEGIGFSPRGPETQIYSIEGMELSLVGTAEITIGGYHSQEIIPAESLPLRYIGLSHCFRTEAGTYGKASKGLYRVHQFSKAEMFIICAPTESETQHEHILAIEEEILQTLEIPYQLLDIASGDLGGPAYRKYDLEAWMPGRGGYGEVTSCSNCTDYQARRLNVRFKEAGAKPQLAHMLNGTAVAVSRMLIAIYENHQREDGSIAIPTALQPSMGGLELIPRRN